MVNNSDFSKRLQKLIGYYDESASSFAEKIGVQRSSISHVLSGRNKPSLDFVMKVLKAYPDVNMYWLLNGKGSFPAQPETSPIQKGTNTNQNQSLIQQPNPEKEIDRIVIFFKDGSFKSYE